MTLRGPSLLTLSGITAMRLDILRRVEGLRGGQGGRNSSLAEDLSNALALNRWGLTQFASWEQYQDCVRDTLRHVETSLEHQDALQVGENVPDILDFDERVQYRNAMPSLTREDQYLASDDGTPSAWVMHEARLDSEARMEALREVRPMGGTYEQGFILNDRRRSRFLGPRRRVTNGDAVAQRAVASTAQVLPRDWVEKASRGTLYVTLCDKDEPSGWSPARVRGGKHDPELTLSQAEKGDHGPMSGWESDALHEMAHHLESVFPEINQIARAHKAVRTTDEEGRLDEVEDLRLSGVERTADRPSRMGTANKYTGWGRPSTFGIVYAGQETGPGASEVFSTGLEAALGGRYGALRGHGGVEADAEHLNLILGILATAGRP